jgi:hypothetical protein
MSPHKHQRCDKNKPTSVGGILKNNNNNDTGNSSSEKKKRVRLQWDEENLQKNETEREPRMTIAEPKTPYHLSDRSDSDSEASAERCWMVQGQDTRNIRLEASLLSPSAGVEEGSASGYYSNNSSQSTPRSNSSSTSSSRLAFERKRKLHYDEFRISKYFMERGDLWSEDSELEVGEESQSDEEETTRSSEDKNRPRKRNSSSFAS